MLKEFDKTIFKVINSRFGISDYSFGKNSIIYSDYSSDGYRILETPFDSITFDLVDVEKLRKGYPIADNLTKQEGDIIDFNKLNDVHYQVKKYTKATHLLNFHSWAPLSIDPENMQVHPGISLMSQNLLSTAETIIGYRYKNDESKGEVYAKFKYMGWFPIFDAEVNYGKAESTYYSINKYINENNEVVKIDTVINNFSWKETNVNISSYVSFNLSRGKYYRSIRPVISYYLTNYMKDADAPDKFPNGTAHFLQTRLHMYQILRSSAQDLLPNFGVIFDFSYAKSLQGISLGSIFSLSNTLYLPGLKKNHGIEFYNAYQKKFRSDYAFSDRIRFPRGHQSSLNDEMYSFGSEYMLPLLYPDYKVGGLAYFKRIKLSVFYDYSFLSGLTYNNSIPSYYNYSLQSTGFQLTADTHFLRFIAPIEFGFRTSYLFNNSFDFDYLFNIQFSF